MSSYDHYTIFFRHQAANQAPNRREFAPPPTKDNEALFSIGTDAPIVWFRQSKKVRFVPGGRGVRRFGLGNAESFDAGANSGRLAELLYESRRRTIEDVR